MRKFWLGLAASCLVLLAVDTAKADHRHRGNNCYTPYGTYGRSYVNGGNYFGYGRSFYPSYYSTYRPYGFYNNGFYGYPAYGPGYYNYGRGYGGGYGGGRVGIYVGF